MALNKEAQKKLLALFGIDSKEIDAIVDSTEEKDATIPEDVKVYNKEDLDTVLENHLKRSRPALQEIMVKDMKKLAGVEFEGKDPAKFLEAYKEHIEKESKVSVDDKVASRDKKIHDLQKAMDELKQKAEAADSTAKEAAFDARLLRSFPKDRLDTMTDEDYLLLIKNKMKVVEEEGKEAYEFNGKRIADDKLNNLPLEDAVKHVFTASNWINDAAAAPAGNTKPTGHGFGGSQTKAGVFNSMKEVRAHIEGQGLHPFSEKARAIYSEALKANPELDMSE